PGRKGRADTAAAPPRQQSRAPRPASPPRRRHRAKHPTAALLLAFSFWPPRCFFAYSAQLNTKDTAARGTEDTAARGTEDTAARGTEDTQATKDTEGRLAVRPNEMSYKVIGAAMKVHSALGSGLLESAYDKCLSLELRRIGLQFQHQVRLPMNYEGVKLSAAYCVDFIVEECIVVEIK